MINEMQAYLMHTPDPRAFSAALLHVTPEKLAELRRRFMDPRAADLAARRQSIGGRVRSARRDGDGGAGHAERRCRG